jgi:hypothetical protein
MKHAWPRSRQARNAPRVCDLIIDDIQEFIARAARNHLFDAERYRFSHCWMKSRITAMAGSGASGIAGNKETVRTERGAEVAPQTMSR